MAGKEKCPYGCTNGRLFDTFMRKYVACPHCTGLTAQLKEDAGNTEAKIELSTQLGIPEVYRGVRFDPKQFFEAKAMARFTTQSADRVLSKLSAIEARIAEANPIVESCYFRVGGNGSMLEYAYSCMQTAFSCGLNVVPFISLRELLIIRDRDVLLRPVHVDSLPKNIKENYYYSDFVKADVCFLMATAEVQQRELNVLTDLLMERARYGKGTYVFGCWLSTGRNMPDRLKAIIDPESRRLCLMHPYEVIERSLATGNVDTSNLPAEYANVGDYGQEYNDPVDRFVYSGGANTPNVAVPTHGSNHVELGVSSSTKPVEPMAASATKPVEPMAASSTKPVEPTITNTTGRVTTAASKPEAPIAPTAPKPVAPAKPAPAKPAPADTAKTGDDNPFAAAHRGKQKAGLAKEALQGIAQAVSKPKPISKPEDATDDKKPLVTDDKVKVPSAANAGRGIVEPTPVDKADTKASEKADAKADVKTDTKADVKADTQAKTEPDDKVEAQVDTQSTNKGKAKTAAKGKSKGKPKTAKNAKKAKSKKKDTRTPEQIAADKARMEKARAGRKAKAAAQAVDTIVQSEVNTQSPVADAKAITPEAVEKAAAPAAKKKKQGTAKPNDANVKAEEGNIASETDRVSEEGTQISDAEQPHKGKLADMTDDERKAYYAERTRKATQGWKEKVANMTEDERKAFYAERTRKSAQTRKATFANMTEDERTAYYAARTAKRRETMAKKAAGANDTKVKASSAKRKGNQ